jgi:hypothetical protein
MRLSVWVVLAAVAACGGSKQEPATPEGKTGGSGAPSAVATGAPTPGNEPLLLAQDPERAHQDPDAWGIVGAPSYAAVVDKVVGMVNDAGVRQAAERRGLGVMNVMWEDTGRAQGSSLGPNITDLTLQVRYQRGAAEEAALMPVIRFPNFADRTGDVPASKLFVRVGNHRNAKDLKTVALTDVLKNLRGFVSKPWAIGGSGNLLAARDTHFLVSAQAVFMPISKEGKATFNPVVFNYQSAPGSPAVLTLLVTRQGTSINVIENSPEQSGVQGMGQELYFNEDGQRAPFTAERRSDVKARIDAQGGPVTADDRSALAQGADVLMLVQVPLKHRNRGMLQGADKGESMALGGAPAPAPASAAPSAPMKSAMEEKSDVEQAVLGHGPLKGPFTEGNGVVLERDPQFPVRITMQFYKATSNGVVDERDLDQIASTIGSVYEHADYVGSLVIPENDTMRPTEWQRMPREWFRW